MKYFEKVMILHMYSCEKKILKSGIQRIPSERSSRNPLLLAGRALFGCRLKGRSELSSHCFGKHDFTSVQPCRASLFHHAALLKGLDHADPSDGLFVDCAGELFA